MGDSKTQTTYTAKYCEKLILAPMVRVSVLPTRLLALDYGADLVYSEEIIDFKLRTCRRIENRVLNTVEFVAPDDIVVFQTCSREQPRVVLQLGTSDGQRALEAAKLVEKDVSGIDVNMGCPKKFSLAGGMGAALLTQPEKITEILTTLVRGLSIPVTCKMRVLPTVEATVEVAKVIQATGVAALTVHGRTKLERPKEANRNDYIRAVVEALDIPVIANGGSADMDCYEDLDRFRRATNASSVMVARAAQKNPSIFSPRGKQPTSVVVPQLIKYALQYDLPYQLCKYCVQSLMRDCLETPLGDVTLRSYSLHDLVKAWNLMDMHAEILKKRRQREHALLDLDLPAKQRKVADDNKDDDIIRLDLKFNRHNYAKGVTPKMILHQWARQRFKRVPTYCTTVDADDGRFRCVLTFEGVKYSSLSWAFWFLVVVNTGEIYGKNVK